ncbi:uncharacterized protein [Periplaneta americana]|uniref:uncharacterized protein n=1 Tax=Periplaneta americana TaxID=6978 RepID=UPI0037E83752
MASDKNEISTVADTSHNDRLEKLLQLKCKDIKCLLKIKVHVAKIGVSEEFRNIRYAMNQHETREREVKESQISVNEITNSLANLKIHATQYEQRYLQYQEEYAKLEEEEKQLKKQLDDLNLKLHTLNKDLKYLNKAAQQMSKEDVNTIDKKRVLLRRYLELTGIKWDFTAPLTYHAGCIFNANKDYSNYFCYSDAKTDTDTLWQEIKNAAHGEWSHIQLEESKGMLENSEFNGDRKDEK